MSYPNPFTNYKFADGTKRIFLVNPFEHPGKLILFRASSIEEALFHYYERLPHRLKEDHEFAREEDETLTPELALKYARDKGNGRSEYFIERDEVLYFN